MKDPKYYLISKSIFDRYLNTEEFDNVYDIANKPYLTKQYTINDIQIIQDHLDTITSLYFDESSVNNFEWDLILSEIKKMLEEMIDKEF
jgi:hypothetical protein